MPLFSRAYRIDKNAMVYALYSKGYRLGGINLVPDTPLSPTKMEYGSDKVNNYELGAKTSWFDGALVVDMTGFYIDWKNIPRSEEHTSELQSLMRISYPVFCLQKKITNKH